MFQSPSDHLRGEKQQLVETEIREEVIQWFGVNISAN